jgi:hypothetical protein
MLICAVKGGRLMVVAMMEISKTTEVVMAVGAIVLLAMATFGLDSLVFSKKRKAGRDPRAPKERIHYVVEDVEEEPEETRKPVR